MNAMPTPLMHCNPIQSVARKKERREEKEKRERNGPRSPSHSINAYLHMSIIHFHVHVHVHHVRSPRRQASSDDSESGVIRVLDGIETLDRSHPTTSAAF
jgi:hypothetical protein